MFNLNSEGVRKIFKRIKENRHPNNRPRSGRPRLTTPHADRRIIRTSRQKSNMSSKDLKNEIQLAISLQTIRRRLNEESLFG